MSSSGKFLHCEHMSKNKYKIMMPTVIFICCCCVVSVLHADVFTLAPFRGGRPWGADTLEGSELWIEPVKVNGVNTGMRLTLLEKDLDESYRILKNKFPDAVFRANEESILVEIKREKGMIERLYLIRSGGAYPVIQFSIEIPAEMPEKPDWPEELPLPPGSSPVIVIDLPDRKTLYGAFVSAISPERVLNDADSTMISLGWSSLGKGIYLKKDPMMIMLVTATEDENGNTHGFVLKRKLKTK